eukprot:m.244145 g.244145  ORF g.244145 m.244145 type:complete len:67 (-) comp33822_c3_seq15:94-294(-)
MSTNNCTMQDPPVRTQHTTTTTVFNIKQCSHTAHTHTPQHILSHVSSPSISSPNLCVNSVYIYISL